MPRATGNRLWRRDVWSLGVILAATLTLVSIVILAFSTSADAGSENVLRSSPNAPYPLHGERACGRVRAVSEGVYFKTRVFSKGYSCRKARQVIRGMSGGPRVAGWNCTGSGEGAVCFRSRSNNARPWSSIKHGRYVRNSNVIRRRRSSFTLEANEVNHLTRSSSRYCGRAPGRSFSRVTADQITCRQARRIIRYWFTFGPGVVEHPSSTGLYYTLRRYPGWTCGSGTGGGSCSKGKRRAGYIDV